MLTREQFDALTDDQKYEHYMQGAVRLTTNAYVRYSAEGIPMDYVTYTPVVLPHDPLPETFRIYGNDGSFRLP